jgi:hypothetical protein
VSEDARPCLKRLPKDKYRLASSSGRDWTVHDYRLFGGRREVLRLGSKVAEYRAFVPESGNHVVYTFKVNESHQPDPLVMELQLRHALEIQGLDPR